MAEGDNGRGRRWWALGAALGAGGGVLYGLKRRRGKTPTEPVQQQPGPVVSDEEFLADERFIFDHYQPATIEGWATRLFDQGEGEAIVFVPIIRGLEVVYAKQLRAFARTHRVLLYERTESLDRPVYVGARVDEIRKVLDHLGIAKAHIVGLGDAGVPAFNFGKEHPDRCHSITSLCLGPRYRVPPYWLNEGIINPLTERLPLEGVVPDKVVRAMVVKATQGGGRLPAHLIGHMVDHIPQQMRVHKYSVLPVTHHHEMREWARTLRVPVLLVNRDDDPLAPVAETEELAALLPNCYGVEIFRDGGRFITYTWADEVNQRLRAFFATVEAGEPAPRPTPIQRQAAPAPDDIGNGAAEGHDYPRATEGPLVSDEQLADDQAYVEAGLRPARVDGWETELFDHGEGEPVLYIPILAHVEVIYARQLRDFSRDHRAITYRRPEATTAPKSIADRVEEVRQLLDHLGIDRAHIVGRGEGAIVASEFAYAYPERCRSLVMISLGMDHKVPPVAVTNTLNWVLLHWPIEGRLLTDESWRLKVVKYLSGKDQRLTYDQLMRVYQRIPDFIKVCKYSVTPLVLYHDLRGKAQRIATPTLLITTDEDPRATRADLEELAAALPDCRGVHVLPHGGRFVNYVQGERVNQLIRQFYAELSPAAVAPRTQDSALRAQD